MFRLASLCSLLMVGLAGPALAQSPFLQVVGPNYAFQNQAETVRLTGFDLAGTIGTPQVCFNPIGNPGPCAVPLTDVNVVSFSLIEAAWPGSMTLETGNISVRPDFGFGPVATNGMAFTNQDPASTTSPAPRITGLSTSRVPYGSGDVELTISGEGFAPPLDVSTTVYFLAPGESPTWIPITSMTDTSITATLPASLLDLPGDFFLYVSVGARNTNLQPFQVGPCPSSPKPGCIVPLKGSFQVNEKTSGKEQIKVALKNLDYPTSTLSFGDPVGGTTAYAVCVYDAVGALVEQVEIDRAGQTCGESPCWNPVSTTGFRYLDKSATADGITSIQAKSGDVGKGQIQAKGRNDAAKGLTRLPTGIAADLADDAVATVQVVTRDAACFGVTFPTVKLADGFTFKAALP